MDKLTSNEKVEEPNLYTIVFGSSFESTLEGIKIKGCELYVSGREYNLFTLTNNLIILNRYLDEMRPFKITFHDVQFGFNSAQNLLSSCGTETELISKIRKIPTIRFEFCNIPVEFYKNLFDIASKIINITFKGCQIALETKSVIMKRLASNYTVRELVIDGSARSSDLSAVPVDGTIKSYLYRNRAIHLCRMAALTIVLMRKYTYSIFTPFDKSLVVYMAKTIYNTRSDPEWLKIVLTDEIKNKFI